jgi:hypothetical protein
MAISLQELQIGQAEIELKYRELQDCQDEKRYKLIFIIQDAARAIEALPDGENVRKYICQISNAEAELRELEKAIYKTQAEKSEDKKALWWSEPCEENLHRIYTKV